MRAFACDVCGNLLVFENSVCMACKTEVGFAVPEGRLVALGAAEPFGGGRRVRCASAGLAACNWLVIEPGLCLSCRLTRTRPDDDDAWICHM